MPHLDATPVRERVADWLEASAPSPEKLRELYRRVPPGSELALLSCPIA